jgi:VanZ family protein
MNRSIARLLTAAAWIAIALIAYATLTRVGFVYAIYFKLSPFLMHPAMQTFAHFEHVIVFAVLGALFGFAYPRHLLLACFIVLGAAALLEILQTTTPDRHGTWVDALEKMSGGAAGIATAKAIAQWRRRDRNQPQGSRVDS